MTSPSLISIASDLAVAVGTDPQLEAAVYANDSLATRERSREVLSTLSGSTNAEPVALLHVFARAILNDRSPLDRDIRDVVARWSAKSFNGHVLAHRLSAERPEYVEALLTELLRFYPQSLAMVLGAARALPSEGYGRVCELAARDEREEVRHHLFELLGKHRRLVPPGSLPHNDLPEASLIRMLRRGLEDASPRVRERATAATYGLGLCAPLSDRLMVLTDDEVEDVRRYALVALGVLDDPQSLKILVDRLGNGPERESTSALWAIARRRDALEHLLSVPGDPRPWLKAELWNAIAMVSQPLTDVQLDALQAALQGGDEIQRARERHINRTRMGEPEVGPEGQVSYLMRKST